MKRTLFTIAMLLLALYNYAAPTELLKKGNDLYAANQFAEAIEVYESIVGQDYESGTLYFNLGNAYYKNGDVPRAILNYERSKLLMPNNDDVDFNLDLANQFVVDKIEALPKPFFIKWGNSLLNSYNANAWGNISLIAFILLLTGATGYFFFSSASLKKASFSVGIVMLVVTISAFSFAKKQHSKIKNRNTAIVFEATVTVKASPDESGTNLFVLHEGVKVEIKEELGLWANIKLADGNSGWVRKEVFEKI